MWMRIDDRLHAHRKTRVLTRSHRAKVRDAAPMGLWVLAGSWASQNATEGWVPESELDRWDDDWPTLAKRLVTSGYWWPETKDGEPGYGFNDWQEWNSPAASESGVFGNHVRWHVQKGVVKDDCEHCPTEPNEDETTESDPESSGATRPDIAPDHRPDIGSGIAPNRLPNPIPTQPQTQTTPKPLLSDQSDDPDPADRFQEFWDTYGHKVKRPDAERKWRLALKKPGVTADLLIAAAAAYVLHERTHNEGGRFIAHPSTWLHGERWRDEWTVVAPQSRANGWLAAADRLNAKMGELA